MHIILNSVIIIFGANSFLGKSFKQNYSWKFLHVYDGFWLIIMLKRFIERKKATQKLYK